MGREAGVAQLALIHYPVREMNLEAWRDMYKGKRDYHFFKEQEAQKVAYVRQLRSELKELEDQWNNVQNMVELSVIEGMI